MTAAQAIRKSAKGDDPTVLVVFETVLKRQKAKGRSPPKGLSYFVQAVADAIVEIPGGFERDRNGGAMLPFKRSKPLIR